jgi:hypothetical protein
MIVDLLYVERGRTLKIQAPGCKQWSLRSSVPGNRCLLAERKLRRDNLGLDIPWDKYSELGKNGRCQLFAADETDAEC